MMKSPVISKNMANIDSDSLSRVVSAFFITLFIFLICYLKYDKKSSFLFIEIIDIKLV